ncbi:hypothetical protein [Capnocytophaga granulosa]|jgi:hypothetical protein
MNKLFQRLLKAKNKIATWVAPIVLLYYFDDKIQLRDRIYYFFVAFFKSIPLLMLYSYFSVWREKNELFFVGISFILFLNMVVGAIYHAKAGTFDIKHFLTGNATIMLVITVVYISLSVLSIPINETETGKIFQSVVQFMTLMYPVSKIVKNVFVLTGGKYPPQFIMKALYNYEREGKLKDFFDDISKGAKDLTIDNHERETTTDSEEQ